MTRRSMPSSFKAPCSLWRAFAVVAKTTASPCSECGTWGRSFSAGSWGHSLSLCRIERSGKCDPVFGRIAGRGFRMGWVAENATRNIALKRDADSPTRLNRKAHPILRRQNGMRFPRDRIYAAVLSDSPATRPESAPRARPGCLPRSRRRRPPALLGRGSPR